MKYTYTCTYIYALEYLPEPKSRTINNVFIGTNEISDV